MNGISKKYRFTREFRALLKSLLQIVADKRSNERPFVLLSFSQESFLFCFIPLREGALNHYAINSLRLNVHDSA